MCLSQINNIKCFLELKSKRVWRITLSLVPKAPPSKKASRPAWDLKGRIADMESKMKRLESVNHEQEELNVKGDEKIKVRPVTSSSIKAARNGAE